MMNKGGDDVTNEQRNMGGRQDPLNGEGRDGRLQDSDMPRRAVIRVRVRRTEVSAKVRCGPDASTHHLLAVVLTLTLTITQP